VSSKIDICNQALVMLGALPIVSFEDETTEANVLSIMYPVTRLQLLRSYPWRSATRYATLAKKPEVPLDPNWDLIFAWPDDAVRILRITGNSYPNDPQPRWVSVGMEVYTCVDDIAAEYIYDIPEPEMDVLMEEALAAKLALAISYTITGSGQRESSLASLYDRKMEEARIVDRQESSHMNFSISTLTDPR